jgi:AraC-like DNA-binding protein
MRESPGHFIVRLAARMDALTAVLQELRFESVGYRWIERDGPFALDFSQEGLRGVHAIESGRCRLELADGATLPLAPGDVVVLPRGDAHQLRSDGPGRSTVLCGAFVVRETEHPVLRGLPHVIAVPRDEEPAVSGLLEALGAEVREATAGSEVVMARLSDALVVQALRHHARSADDGWLSGLRDPHLAPVLGEVHTDPGHAWTLDELARVAGLSRAAFAARFSARLGQPALRYVTAVRMQRARAMLRDERVTVAAIAARLGYGSEAAFSTAFKRETGRSPSAMRG